MTAIDFDAALAAMPAPVRARASFLRDQAGIDMEAHIADVQVAYRDGMSVNELARTIHVDVRTIYRYLQAFTPCPGSRCLTMVRGGGRCRFCSNSQTA